MRPTARTPRSSTSVRFAPSTPRPSATATITPAAFAPGLDAETAATESPTDGRGGDLYTEKPYENFELRFTYKVTWLANSGIWFRGKYQYDSLKYKNPVGYSGTLYMPGWPKTFITRNLKEELERRDGWNEGQVYAAGDHLVLWLNGTKTGDCRNDAHAKGPIGIQVHPGGGARGWRFT